MASDGLWELLGNDEVVALMGRWVDQQEAIRPDKGKGEWEKYMPVSSEGSAGLMHRGPRGSGSVHSEDRFVLEDRNAATHLLRNALGGRLHDAQMACAMLTLSYPLNRRHRDDLSIMIIFFGDIRDTAAERKS
ncbi:hypothetical protein Aspvir_006407 [Aspergillus viridinutans]|uniref:PPM-type phosphatase domain-containing protein n=1 Tax=Aspergillus viridinutans TaxID=75553 RepID=A0A9P3BXC9_ASPVI|nr:uncharacterized protein Aspvir_006407 [Aspergillus viridinutans]GIK02358.1 hypothetical protein Aspvir_006407 [Aspergillus viridinutans]